MPRPKGVTNERSLRSRLQSSGIQLATGIAKYLWDLLGQDLSSEELRARLTKAAISAGARVPLSDDEYKRLLSFIIERNMLPTGTFSDVVLSEFLQAARPTRRPQPPVGQRFEDAPEPQTTTLTTLSPIRALELRCKILEAKVQKLTAYLEVVCNKYGLTATPPDFRELDKQLET